MLKLLLTCTALIAFGSGSASAQQREAVFQKIEVPNASFDIVLQTQGSLHPDGEPDRFVSEHAGVVTYVCDQLGRVWSIADVAPGGAERCPWAYVSSVDLGDTAVDHRSLGRGGLHLQHATAGQLPEQM